MYKLTLINIHSLKEIETKSFETKKEANREKRSWGRALELVKHAGHFVNYSKGIEMNTNY